MRISICVLCPLTRSWNFHLPFYLYAIFREFFDVHGIPPLFFTLAIERWAAISIALCFSFHFYLFAKFSLAQQIEYIFANKPHDSILFALSIWLEINRCGVSLAQCKTNWKHKLDFKLIEIGTIKTWFLLYFVFPRFNWTIFWKTQLKFLAIFFFTSISKQSEKKETLIKMNLHGK